MQVGWEISKVMETLKASGHEVSLVINAGNKNKEPQPPNEESPKSTPQSSTTSLLQDVGAQQVSHKESIDSPHHLANAEPLTNTSLSTNTSDALSSSQDTLDGIVDSPASFEGDTDFSGMEKLLVKSRLPLDLQRTSSAPLIDTGALDTSGESGLSSVDSRAEEKRVLSNGELGSLEGIDGRGEGRSKAGDDSPFERRLQMRTASDGTVVEKTKKSVS